MIAQLVKNLPAMQETWVQSLDWEDPLEKGKATHSSILLTPRSGRFAGEGIHTPAFLSFPCDSAGKESACNPGNLGSIPGLRRSPGEGKGYPLQYSGLENSMNIIVHRVTKSQTRLSNFHFHVQEKKNCPETQKHQQTIIVKATISASNESAVELIHIEVCLIATLSSRWLN